MFFGFFFLLDFRFARPPRPLGEGAGGEGITPRGLEVEGSSSHAARGSDGRHKGRQGSHDDFYHDFDDVFLFVVHRGKI